VGLIFGASANSRCPKRFSKPDEVVKACEASPAASACIKNIYLKSYPKTYLKTYPKTYLMFCKSDVEMSFQTSNYVVCTSKIGFDANS